MQQKKPKIQIIIGLGNPGLKYLWQRHSIGYLFIDFLLKRFNKDGYEQEKNFLFQKISIDSRILILAKPRVFMNNSGKALKEIKKKFHLKTKEMLVVQDDSDLEFGKFKLSYGSGSAGHKGIESIFSEVGSKNFYRLRLGIRPKILLKKKRWIKAKKFVLKEFSKEERKELKNIFKQAAGVLSKFS